MDEIRVKGKIFHQKPKKVEKMGWKNFLNIKFYTNDDLAVDFTRRKKKVLTSITLYDPYQSYTGREHCSN